jgi:hypothetical protein
MPALIAGITDLNLPVSSMVPLKLQLQHGSACSFQQN